MYTYRFNIPLAFLFCRPLPSIVLVIFPGANILQRNLIKNLCWEFKNKRRSRTKCAYCIHWWMSLHNVWAVICSGMAWKSLFGQMITGLPVSIKTQDSDFTWEWSLSNVAEIFWRISCAEKKKKEGGHISHVAPLFMLNIWSTDFFILFFLQWTFPIYAPLTRKLERHNRSFTELSFLIITATIQCRECSKIHQWIIFHFLKLICSCSCKF